jgi:hypothetical protein
MCDLEREIGLRLSGRILGVHPFANPNNALAPGREQIGVNGERAICAPQMLLRRGRGDEFLEARIIPERIEHWIEPEHRGGERLVKSPHHQQARRDPSKKSCENQAGIL